MAHPVIMPKPGQFTEECTIIRWLKNEGDKVAKGDILFEIETDKAAMEVESFYDGTLIKIIGKKGDTFACGQPVAYIGQPGEKIETPVATPAPVKPAAEAPKPEAKPAPAVVTPTVVAAAAPVQPVAAPSAPMPAAYAVTPAAAEKPLVISPRARALAERSAINPSRIQGTGPNGRIVTRDVEAHLAKMGYANLRVSPAAKQLAIKEKIDILTVKGSGDAGRIMVSDIERAMAERPQAMSKMRQVIAQRLAQSVVTAPHFFVTVEVDMTDLVAYREELKAAGKAFTVTDFIMEAVTLSLKEFPAVNSSTDGRNVWWHGKVHLGVAVSLDSGLVVPVVRNADDLSLSELHDAAATLVKKAREGKLLPDEMSGSTFTISNMGMMNVDEFTAIINPPEAAILAVSSTVKKPVVRDQQIVIRQMMRITLSSDHRIIDGSMAARFANAIKAKLEDMNVWKAMT